MNTVWKIFLKGLVAVLPTGLTLYLIYWLAVSVEKVFRPMITALLPEQYYLPGFGLITGVVLLFFIGLLVNAWIFKKLLSVGENLLERIPLVKSVYGALRDFMDYFSPTAKKEDLKKVVLVTLNEIQLIGFVTGSVDDFPGASLTDDKQANDRVAVYLPMSYQLGGFTVYLPKSSVEAIDISVEDAMRRVLTAGLSTQKSSGKSSIKANK